MNCRFGPKRPDDVLDLAPGISDLECSLTPINPGPFRGQLSLFVEDGGLREIVLTVRGTGVANGPSGEGGQP
ncbi:MAG: hypothetical protein U0797_08840 [Gemmataceae bacterium]